MNLFTVQEENLNRIQKRAKELLEEEITALKTKAQKLITDGTIDEGIALAISKNQSEYQVLYEHANKNIDYRHVLNDFIQTLKKNYEPTYIVKDRYQSGYVFDSYTIILSLQHEVCIIF